MIIITDTYSQPDAPDPVLSDDRVLELARRHAGSARKVTFVDESGGEARAYMCDDDLVFKTQRPQQLRPRTSLEKEAFILGQLAAQADVPVPRVLGYGREDDVEYLLMTRIPGVPLETTALSGPARIAVLPGTRRHPPSSPRRRPGRCGGIRTYPRRRICRRPAGPARGDVRPPDRVGRR